MADEARSNGQIDGNSATAGGEPQQIIVNAQYVKDLSFENPRAPQSLLQQTAAPSVDVNVDVKARNLGPDVYEVVLTINASAKTDGETVFLVELAYGTVVTIRNASETMLPALILVETPRLLFPFARNIVAEATRDGGFPPLLINPIDFAELLRRQQAAQAAGETGTLTA